MEKGSVILDNAEAICSLSQNNFGNMPGIVGHIPGYVRTGSSNTCDSCRRVAGCTRAFVLDLAAHLRGRATIIRSLFVFSRGTFGKYRGGIV